MKTILIWFAVVWIGSCAVADLAFGKENSFTFESCSEARP